MSVVIVVAIKYNMMTWWTISRQDVGGQSFFSRSPIRMSSFSFQMVVEFIIYYLTQRHTRAYHIIFYNRLHYILHTTTLLSSRRLYHKILILPTTKSQFCDYIWIKKTRIRFWKKWCENDYGPLDPEAEAPPLVAPSDRASASRTGVKYGCAWASFAVNRSWWSYRKSFPTKSMKLIRVRFVLNASVRVRLQR